MTTVSLIVGNTGAGKSTYAAKLSHAQDAHVFAVDEWMKTLFLADQPNPPSYEWALERVERIEVQILRESLRLLERRVNVILDLGFFQKVQRMRVLDFFSRQGQTAVVHYLDVDKETRWQRVNHRNTRQTETYQFEVSREIFEFCETIFEPLDGGELRDAVVVPV
ncbi:AAA family ATPase [Algihabitans albus]|uniref:AAA family ATPase n=1 Tax=Algihabitans albus TaxID=2164067 RepID=UPI0013C2C878|nr:ATP-binding protein [Algihabitans albus]